jgi:hypothetical protein
MMNKHALGALAIAAVSLGVGTAQSARMPGSSGHAWPRASASCFEHTNALMENTCIPQASPPITQRLLVVPMPLTNTLNAQSYNISARIRGNGIHFTTCQGLLVNEFNSANGTITGSTTSTNLTNVSMGSPSATTSHVLQVECLVAPLNNQNGFRGGVLRVTADPF